jgi:prevent-host-death family protein
MTRTTKAPPARKPPHGPGRWPLQDAKARFSELVRRARSEGPQSVTVHGREEVVVVSAEEFHRLQGNRTDADLIAATALHHGLTLVSRDTADFEKTRVPLLNPWRARG